MKRYGRLWEQISSRENIEQAANNALANKKLAKAHKQFMENRQVLLDKIEYDLKNETYQLSPLKSFTVYEPKERVIHHPPFYPDKIIHHCLMNVIQPLLMEKFTADTYGSLKGRGVSLAAEKLKKALSLLPDHYYFLQIDIKKFYSNIDHDVVKAQIRRVFKCNKTLTLLDQIIDCHDPGLAIGIYPSQYLANLVMSPVDHWAKEILRIEHYFRYMDDIVILVPDKEEAHEVLRQLSVELKKLKLSVKDNVRIAPLEYGIDFIGYKFYPTHTRLRKRIKVKMQKTVRQLEKVGADDKLFKQKTASHFGWCKHGDCRNLLRTTFKDKIYLYEKSMEFKRLSEIKESENWFGLAKDRRISIESLYNVDVIFFEYLITTIRNETKAVVKFAFADKPEDFHFFITRSDVMRDRLERDKELMPFIVTIKKVKNYIAYE